MLLNEIEIFYFVVEYKSFSKAAEQLNLSKSYVSKRITFLENELKTKLLSRNTRKITLTEAGESFYKQCVKVILEAKKSYQLVDAFHQNPVGTLKISAPTAFAVHLLPTIVSEFIKKFPDIKIVIDCENRLVDVVKDGYDLVLRSAKLESSSLIAQKLFTFKNVICASPAYLKMHKKIIVPADLSLQYFAIYQLIKENNELKLLNNNRTYQVKFNKRITTNQLDLIKQMVLNDACLGVLPEFMVKKEIERKAIVTCLSDYELPPSHLYLIYPNKELQLPKVKAFIKMLKRYE